MASNRAPEGEQLRRRLSAWARYVYAKNRYPSVASMSRDLDFSQGSLNQIMNGVGSTGLDFAVKLALAGHESLDTLCLREPAAEYFTEGARSSPAPPPPAPRQPASPPRQAKPARKAGGHGR